MKTAGILFLGGAKRVAMARLFKAAAAARGIDCRIYSSEIGTHHPIATEATVVEGLRWSDPGLYDRLQQQCRELGISVAVPFVDGAVSVAARLHELMPEVFAPTSSDALAEAMFDKVRAASVFEAAGLPVPPTWRGGAVDGPLIAKPRHGSASKGIVLIDSATDLAAIAAPDDYIIQRRFDRREEISVDCYVSVHTGEPIAIVPRIRLEVAGGEAVRTKTISDDRSVELVRRTLAAVGLRGAVTVQLLHDLDSDALFIMEINPRLGGGAVCAVHAGADLPGMILDEARGIVPAPAAYRPDTEIARYLQEVVFYN